MTREDKELLFKDLCGRLPYGVKVKYLYWDEEKGCEYPVPMILDDINSDGYIRFHGDIVEEEGRGMLTQCLPYLRPMSSMTEEEVTEFISVNVRESTKYQLPNHESLTFWECSGVTDWLNANNFDYRGLIEKGLAIKAPEWMYKIG